jgi:hypothetical protein
VPFVDVDLKADSHRSGGAMRDSLSADKVLSIERLHRGDGATVRAVRGLDRAFEGAPVYSAHLGTADAGGDLGREVPEMAKKSKPELQNQSRIDNLWQILAHIVRLRHE